MLVETVRVDWVRDQIFLLRDHFDYPVVMTQPAGVTGADLLPLSLAGCALWDIVAILRKQRQPLARAEAAAESERDSQPPWRFRRIHLRYCFAGRGLRPASVRRAVDLAENKYCSIHATLRAVIALTSEFEIVEA